MSDRTRITITGTRSGKLRARIYREGHPGSINVSIGSDAWNRKRTDLTPAIREKTLMLARIYIGVLEVSLKQNKGTTHHPHGYTPFG